MADITIAGLTKRQKNLMDLIWGCKDIEQVNTLIAAMPTDKDKQDCKGLVTILMQEVIEQELGLEDYRDAALTCISRARSV